MATVAELRAEREGIHQQIEQLRMKARDISAIIRKAEGPIPDRSNRSGKGRVSMTVSPTKPAE